MQLPKFQEWCRIKESKLDAYRTHYAVNGILFVGLFVLVIGFIYISNYYQETVYNIPDQYDFVVFLLILAGSGIIVYSIGRLFPKPMTRMEFLSCLLNKISHEIELFKTDESLIKDIESDLKHFKKFSNIKYTPLDLEIFDKQIEAIDEFFDNLELLSSRLYYRLEKRELNKVDTEHLKYLAYYIKTDDQKMIEIMNQIVKDNPKIKEKVTSEIPKKVIKIWRYRLVKLAIIAIPISIASYLSHLLIGIDINYAYGGAVSLIIATIYILFKKS